MFNFTNIFSFIVIIVMVGLVVYFITVYNGLVRLNNQIENAFAQISVQLKRRHDLIPNLVESSKMYLSHENQTLTAVMAARNGAQAAQQEYNNNPSQNNLQNLANKESILSKALGGLYVVVENYPELKADLLIKQLMDELTNTENRIGFARQHYNDSVMFYNNSREIFPNNLISGFFGFVPLQGLEFQDRSVIQKVPSVQLV